MKEISNSSIENKDTFKDYILQIPNFLALFLVPITYLSITPALIEIGKNFNTAPGNISLIFTFFPAGIVAGQLTSIFYNRRFKRASIILTCYALLILLNIILFFINHLAFFYILSIFGGYLIGINYVQSTENILACKVKNKDRIVTLMITFYPIGALIAPLISSSLVKNNISWRYTYLIVATITIMIMILYMSISIKGQNKIIANTVQKISMKEIFVNRKINFMYFMTLFIAATYIIGEMVYANWSPTYLRLAKGFDTQSAALGVTFFQIFIVIGRFAASSIVGKIKVRTILLFISCLAIISTALFVASHSKFFIYATISLAGLGYSAMYPLLLSSGSTLYNKGRGILSSLIFASAYSGITAAPFIIKSFAVYNLNLSVLIAMIFAGVAALMILLLVIYEKYYLNKTDTKEEPVKEGAEA
ncbi:MAG: MFS transporter [Candidatus Humimicrobiaceae bacterium]